MQNKFELSRSERALENIETLKREDTNILNVMNDTGYLTYGEKCMIHVSELLNVCLLWCKDNALVLFSDRMFTMYIKEN